MEMCIEGAASVCMGTASAKTSSSVPTNIFLISMSSQDFLLPTTSRTMPPTSAMAPATGGNGNVLVFSSVTFSGPISMTFSLVV